MLRYGNEANFLCFLTFQTLECSKHLHVTNSSSVPTVCNFSENRLFLDSN